MACRVLYQLVEVSSRCELEGIHSVGGLRPAAIVMKRTLAVLQGMSLGTEDTFGKVCGPDLVKRGSCDGCVGVVSSEAMFGGCRGDGGEAALSVPLVTRGTSICSTGGGSGPSHCGPAERGMGTRVRSLLSELRMRNVACVRELKYNLETLMVLNLYVRCVRISTSGFNVYSTETFLL